MRILIVDVNFDYKNPMYRQSYVNLSSCMDVDYWGPGYSSRDELEKGICSYVECNKSYDAIIMGMYFACSGVDNLRYDAYFVHRKVIPYYRVNDAYQCCKNALFDLMDLDHKCKIFAFYEDDINMTQDEHNFIVKLIRSGFYIWTFDSDKQKGKEEYLTNNAFHIKEKFNERIIPLTIHAISYGEIFYGNYYERPYEWNVPGNKNVKYYPERTKALELIKKKSKNVWEYDPYQGLNVGTIERNHIDRYYFRNNTDKLVSFIIGKNKYVSSYPNMESIAACREIYMESMRKCKKLYCEPGIGNCMVRKYYEACASGSLLVAKDTYGLEQMGFENMKNCIIIHDYSELISLAEGKISESDAKEIAYNGQQLILNKHMFQNRAYSMKTVIESILNGKYNGAVWTKGDFILN